MKEKKEEGKCKFQNFLKNIFSYTNNKGFVQKSKVWFNFEKFLRYLLNKENT